MRKGKTLKYLILTFIMAISFFMFSNVSISAVEVPIEGNYSFELEMIDDSDPSKGYSIVGVVDACDTDNNCTRVEKINNLTIPSEYDNKPIVSIADGISVKGVLQKLSNVVVGKISGGSNLETIGTCAFCNFSKIDEIELAESVKLIKNYAFGNSSITTLDINRYNSLGMNKITAIESSLAFDLVVNLKNIVMKNNIIVDYYKNADVWKECTGIGDKFTYRITYRFFNEKGNYEEHVYYNNRELGMVPANLVKTGFDFSGWYSREFEGNQVTAESYARVGELNATFIHEVEPRFELKSPNLAIATYVDGAVDADNKIIYAGKDQSLDMKVTVNHILKNEAGFEIKYLWKSYINSITTDLQNNTDTHSINFVRQSGKYICSVEIKYLTYSKIVEISLDNVQIEAKELVIEVNDNTTEYGTYVGAGEIGGKHFKINNTTSLVNGETIKDYSYSEYTNSNSIINVGSYPGVLEVSVLEIGYEDDEENYINNYLISYVKGDLTVEKKYIVALLEKNINVVYGDVENLSSTVESTIYDNGTETLNITYSRENSSYKNAGSYLVTGVSVDNENYEISLRNPNNYKVVISPKKVPVIWNFVNNVAYDGNEKSATAIYKNINGEDIEVDIVVKKDNVNSKLVNAGTYSLTAVMKEVNNNYVLDNATKEFKIAKADSEFIGDITQTKVYNGDIQRVDVSLNHSEGVINYGDYSKCKNAHLSSVSTCAITVFVEETENYNALTSNFYLHIAPYEIIVAPDVFTVSYGQKIGVYDLSKKYTGINDEVVTVYFAKEVISGDLIVGKYNISRVNSTDNSNYKVVMAEGSGVNKLQIVPAPIQVMFYFYENLVYDGNVKDIGIRCFGTTEEVGLRVDYGDKKIIKNAGNYRIDVSLTNPNFYIEGNDYLEFSIAKANYDVSNLKLNSKKVNFSFKNHFIKLEGELPEGLTASYTIDGNKGNGTFAPSKHTVVVTFDGDYENYNEVESMSAVLNVSMAWVWITLFSVIFVFGSIAITGFVLIKTGKLRFAKKIKRSKFRKIIKKNKELDLINSIISESKKQLDDSENQDVIIEDPVKFIKNPVKVNPEDVVSMAFVDRLFKSEIKTKQIYSDVKNELLSYEGIVSKIKRDYETFYLRNIPVAKFDVVDGVLYVYFALDPNQYRAEQYKHKNVGKKKDFITVPLMLKVDSIESLRHAKMFVRIIRKRENIKSVSQFVRTDYVSIYSAKDTSFKLFKKAFVKKNKKKDS